MFKMDVRSWSGSVREKSFENRAFSSREANDRFNLQWLEAQFAAVKSWPDLDRLLLDLTRDTGFDYYALTWRVKRHSETSPEPLMLFLQNYPTSWVKKWRQLVMRGKQDPVLQAARETSVPFLWADLDKLDVLDTAGNEFMRISREEGLGDGFSVPLHTADGAAGACHFAVRPDRSLPKHDNLVMVGLLACNAAHRVSRAAEAPDLHRSTPRLTPRQIECTVLAARGLTEVAIAQALDISDETVKRHLKQARQTYNVSKTIQLITRCLHDESITFAAVVNERVRDEDLAFRLADPSRRSRGSQRI